MKNADVARVFHEIADLLELGGEDSFRVTSYRRAGRAIDDLATDITTVAAAGELTTIPGIGKAIAEKINELLATGRVRVREELGASVPPALLQLLRIPGMGPKKVALVWRECGVTSLEELRSCIERGGLANLKGFGQKSIDQIRQGITFVESSTGRAKLGWALPLARELRQRIATFPGVQAVEYAGSLRRGAETVGDLDFLCVAADGPATITHFSMLPGVRQVLASGPTKGSILLEPQPGRAIQVDLRVVPADSFGAALQYFTGSKEHNVKLRELAVRRGWSLNEYALTEGERVIASRSEQDIYAALGLPWIPPELRESRGEFTVRETPPLIELADIRGDLHMHTDASDGKATIVEMVQAARARGYEYICITDHSQSSVIAGGLKPERLLEHVENVRRVAAQFPDITVWCGAEVDILQDRLDYPDELLARLDWVVASVHFGMGHDLEANMRRALLALRNRHVNLLAHPTGRMISKREGMPLDLDALTREAARTGTALEINASANRLDLKDVHARLAQQNGALLCIDTDAHSTGQLEQMSLGVITARRGWLRKEDVLNTRSAAEVREFVQRKRSGD